MLQMTAEVLGVEYNFKPVDIMAGENKSPEYLAINPMHNIPAMVDGDFKMNESRAIAAYLVNKYGKDDSLYPKVRLNTLPHFRKLGS
jgi:glutathione S-transferase